MQAPYPADTRAKGWRFELDYEKVEQSGTWALAPTELRPWLLMLWMTAWKQVPCGSLDDDDALIAARIGMPTKIFMKHRDVLRRGWWRADDGRLYHDTIALRVLEMLEKRRKDAARKGNQRGTTKESAPSPTDVPRDTTVTDDTRTGTRTSTREHTLSGVSRASPGEACRAMKSAGMQAVNPSSPKLIALLDAGITVDELTDAARDAVQIGKPFAYALAMAEGRRRDAATAPLPDRLGKQEAIEARNAAVGAEWLRKSEAFDAAN